jgi:hypothetical protein
MSDCAMTYCHVCGDFLFNGLHRGNVERWCRELSETISARPVETIFASPISETISVRRGRPRNGATSETITAGKTVGRGWSESRYMVPANEGLSCLILIVPMTG